MKKLFIALAAVVASMAILLCGCTSTATNGRDGRNGKDVSIYEIYEATNAARVEKGLEELDFLDFISEYLSYDSGQLDTLTSTQNTINRSLLSGVAVLGQFSYTTRVNNIFGGSSTRTSYGVSMGSGVIVDLDKTTGDAYVVTNCHVIYDYSSNETYSTDIRLYLYGQDTMYTNYDFDSSYSIINDEQYRIPATIVSASITYDIALLKVEGSEVLKNSDALAAQFSDEEDVHVGEYVYAIGNGSGEGVAATDGIISRDSEVIALNLKNTSSTSDYVNYRVLRTDAAINGGNSGGALYNKEGKIVGIVNAKAGDEDIDNMGYALPASTVKRVVASMIDNSGSVSRGVKKALLGIRYSIDDTYSEYSEELGVALTREVISVQEVTAGGAAAAAGSLQAGDTLVSMEVGTGEGSSFTARDGVEVTHYYSISDLLLAVRKGDVVKLTVLRSDGEHEIYIPYDSDSFFTSES